MNSVDLTLIYVVVAGLVVLSLALFFVLKSKKGTGLKADAQSVEPILTGTRSLTDLLAKTQNVLSQKFEQLMLKTKNFDKAFIDELEEILYTSDLGPKTVERLLERIRASLDRDNLKDLAAIKYALSEEISAILESASANRVLFRAETLASRPWVVLVVGVNGVGKTTSIGKLAKQFADKRKKVLIVAGDTFRAAAESQLSVWAQRANVEFFNSEQTRDPGAVAFQGLQKAQAEKFDVVIVDTAGRLHNKENLMEELKKVKRVIGKALSGAPDEVILVLDANSGQNAKLQAQQFNEALGVTSLIVTKLDGTAKGGIIVSIADELGLGVQFIGTGEKITDLTEFSTKDYTKGLLGI